MADVSVEFGAKDTGLEQTLKTVQNQLSALEAEVKSGELSFEELQQTMRKIAQAEKVQEQLNAMATAMDAAGSSASTAEPKLNALGNEATEMGNKVEGAGQTANSSAGLFDASFAKIAGAFTVGNIAAKGFEKIVEGVFSAARAVVDSFGEALDLGGRLNELSQRTGETAGNLLVLEGAFKNSGLAVEQVGQVINKLQNFMQDASNGGERQTATMNRLGISMEQLAGKTPTQQMEIFAARISAIEDPTQRAAAASEVFGDKLGGRLLPLLAEFPQTLDDSRNKVGSLAEIMDENAATFDAAGESIDAVKGKMAAFAAGILSETIPAVQDLGTAMEEVDAAGLGQQVGEMLAPALQSLSDATSGAIEVLKQLAAAEQAAANDTGALGKTYDAVNESLIGFNQMMHNAFTQFTPFGAGMEYLRQKGEELRAAKDEAAAGVEGVGAAATETTPKLTDAATAADTLGASLLSLSGEGSGPFIGLNEGATEFKSLLGESEISLADMTGEIGGQIPLQAEQVGLVGQLNTSLGGVGEQMSAQLELLNQQNIAEAERNAKIAERQAKSAADYQLQIQINEALAAGNVEEAKALEYKRELERLTQRIVTETGLSRDEAASLATELIKSRIAAAGISANIDGAKTSFDNANSSAQTVKQTIDEIAKTEADKSMKSFKEQTDEVRGRLENLKNFIGQDLSNMSLENIMTELGIDGPLLDSTEVKLEQVKRAVDAIESADPADITPIIDEVGTKDKINTIKGYLDTLTGIDATPYIDREQIGDGVDATKNTIEAALDDVSAKVNPEAESGAIESAKKSIEEGLSNTKADLALDAAASIQSIREELAKPVEVTLTPKPGEDGGGGNALKSVVDAIKGLVEKIEGKLPMQALA